MLKQEIELQKKDLDFAFGYNNFKMKTKKFCWVEDGSLEVEAGL